MIYMNKYKKLPYSSIETTVCLTQMILNMNKQLYVDT